MVQPVALVVVSLVVILAGAELFTNSIEWFGRRLQLGEGAVGSVLAAVGTALPETIIPVIAIVFENGQAADEIGIGAILGAPLMLSTLGFLVTGSAVLWFARRGRRGREVAVDPVVIGRDLRSFLPAYAFAIGAAVLPGPVYKAIAAVLLVGLYVWYVRETFRRDTGVDPGSEGARALRLQPKADIPRLRFIALQIIVSLALIVGGAHVFVVNLEHISLTLGVSALVLSVIITPVATELPEKFNSVLWVRQGKDTLAMGNITGAMVFQSTVLPAIGLVLTPWELTDRAIAAGVVAIAAAGLALADIVRRKRVSPYTLLAGGFFYALFLGYVILAPQRP